MTPGATNRARRVWGSSGSHRKHQRRCEQTEVRNHESTALKDFRAHQRGTPAKIKEDPHPARADREAGSRART